jgi:hypothetical protein
VFRIILLFVLTGFLFLSILGTADILFSNNGKEGTNLIAQSSETSVKKLTIKQIETISAINNLYFTYNNALK